MTRATEEWQEKARHTADRGTPPAKRTGLRCLRRPLLIVASVCTMCALMAVATYASRGWNAPHPVDQPAKVALATSEPAKRRSYTRDVISEAMSLPAPAGAEASARAGVGHNTLSDPVTTGTVSVPAAEEAPRKASGIATATPSKQPTPRQARVLSDESVAKALSRKATARGRPDRSERHARGRPNRSERHWALRSGSNRVVAAAPAQAVAVCLLFIGCF